MYCYFSKFSLTFSGNKKVDAFGIPDVLLRVPLANADGSSYDAYLDAVRGSRLNKQKVWPHWKEMIGVKVKPEQYK